VSGLPLMHPTFYIQLARVEEAAALSDLCFRSKAVWGYDPEFMARCPPPSRSSQNTSQPVMCLPYPDQRTAEVLTFFQQAHRQPQSRPEQLVRTLGLEPALTSRLASYQRDIGGGFCWRSGFWPPRPMLLMDEPFDGFDLRQTREVTNLLREPPKG
jgi:hypothetical protein